VRGAGRHIPLVVENVRGAQKWVGRSRWNYGSFHLWGDVPALMPMAKQIAKRPGHDWNRFTETGEISPHWRTDGTKNSGGSWFRISHNKVPSNNARDELAQVVGHTPHMTNPAEHDDGIKQPGLSGTRANGKGDAWFQDGAARHSSKSNARKQAAATIAKIPLPLSRYIAAVFKPEPIVMRAAA
jgi:hypothetical protein